MTDLEERVKVLEAQVDLLRRAIGLLGSVGKPTTTWLDASWKIVEEEP